MAGNELTIRISAQDDASKVFQTLAKTAQTVADSLEAAGKEGASGFKQVESGASRANSSLMKLDSTGTGVIRTFSSMGSGIERFISGITTMGSGLETVGRTLDTLGQSYINQERQLDTLHRQYGEATDDFLQFADQIQNTTLFSNDQVRQAEIYFATLKENYGVTEDQIKRLIQVSADLAQAHGMSLEDAAFRVQSAIRGEAEAAEALGLTMNQQSIDRDNLTLSMTNQEAAQFRLNALWQQSAYALGTANDAVNTANGRWRQFGNELQDAAQQAGAFVGPWGQIIGTTGGGLATLGQAAQGIREIVGGLKELKAWAASGVGTFGLIGAAVGVASYGVVKMIGDIHDLESATKALDRLDVEFEIKGEFDKQRMLEDVRSSFTEAVKELSTFTGFGDVSNELKSKIGAVFAEAFADPSVDSAAFANWFTSNIQTLIASGDDQALRDFIKAAADPAVLDQFRGSVDAAADSVTNLGEAAKATAAEVKSIFSDLPAALDDLRIDGKGALADQLDSVHKGIIDAFTPSTQEVAFANRETLKMLPAEDQQALLDGLTSKTDLSTEAAGRLDTAWTRISTNMQSGLLDNAAIIDDINAILTDDSLSGDQKVAEIEKVSLSLSQYIDKYAQLKDAQVEWLANGDNFLDWWQSYQQTMADTAGGVGAAGEAWLKFAEDVDIAADVQESGKALDQVLRTFQEIDSLGQRSASAGSIADKLIGAPGEIGELQDLWDRIASGTSDAVLAQDDYNNAISAGIAIQESNVRVQDDLNIIRAKQMPLLQQEQEAYEANIERISALNAVEARRVLLLQDTAVQSQVAALYSQAYAAAIGEVPKDVTTKMILEAAEADAGLKDLLLNLGLLQQNSDGTISVNFPDADSVGASIDRVTLALLHMQAVAEGKSVYQLAVELYGEEEARRLLGMVEDVDGKTSTMNFTVVSTGVDEAGNNIQTIQLADGTQITVVVGVSGLDQLGKADSDIKAVTLADGTVVTVKTDVDTTGWENKNFQDLINGGEAVEVKTTLKPPDGWSVEGWNSSDGEGSTGGLPDIEIGTTVKPITETPAYEGAPVEVPVSIQMGNPTVGDGTGGPLAGLDGASRQIVIDAVLQGTAQADIDALVRTADGADGKTVTMTATANVGSAVIGIQNVQMQADNFGNTSVSATLGATDNASGTIQNVIDLMGSFQSKTVTLAVNTVYSTTGVGPTARHGGIPEYATGGVLFRGGEAGPEIAHFAGGGMATLPYDGLYLGPQGTRIEPANSAATKLSPGGMGGAPHVTVIIQGNVIGIEDLEAKVGGAIARGMAEVKLDRDRALGVA